MPMGKNKSQAHQPKPLHIYNIYLPTGSGIYKPQNTSLTNPNKRTNPSEHSSNNKTPIPGINDIHPSPQKNARSTKTQKPQQQHEQAKSQSKKQSFPHTSSPGQKSSSRQSRPHETRAHFPRLLLSSSFYGARVLIIVVKGGRLIGGDKKA